VPRTTTRPVGDDADEETTPRPRSIRRDTRLAVAAELFRARGYHATGMDDIGEAAGITGPAVYRHFRSKEDILETIATEYGAPVLERATRIVQEAETPQEALVGLADHYVDTLLTHPAVSAVAMYERRILRPETRAAIERMERLHVEEWVHVLSLARPDLSDGRARVMVHAVLGLGLSACSYNSGLPDDALRPLLSRMIVLALQAE
jgi:AcrR family transcriptional regulator